MYVSRTTIQNFSWENNCSCLSWYCGGDLHSGGLQICLLKRKWGRKEQQIVELDLQWESWKEKTLLWGHPHVQMQEKWHKRSEREESSRSRVFISICCCCLLLLLLLLLFVFVLPLGMFYQSVRNLLSSLPPSYPTLILIKSIFSGTFGSCPFLFFSSFNSFFKLLYLASIFAPSPFEFCILMLYVGRRKKLHRNSLKVSKLSPTPPYIFFPLEHKSYWDLTRWDLFLIMALLTYNLEHSPGLKIVFRSALSVSCTYSFSFLPSFT